MDRNSIAALFLIFLILAFTSTEIYKEWMYGEDYKENSIENIFEQEDFPENSNIDNTAANLELNPAGSTQTQAQDNVQVNTPAVAVQSTYGSILVTNLDEKKIIIDTPLYRGTISTKGATIEEWIIKAHKVPNGDLVNIIRDNIRGNLALSFISNEQYDVDLSKFDFMPVGLEISGSERVITLDDERTIAFKADLGNGMSVIKTLTFDPFTYNVMMDVKFENMFSIINNNSYVISWGSGLKTTEKDTEEDMRYSYAMVLFGSDIESYDVDGAEYRTEKRNDGTVNWIATRSKYFTTMIAPIGVNGKGYRFSGQNLIDESDIGRKSFKTELFMPLPQARGDSDKFLFYAGPIDYYAFKDLEALVGEDLELSGVLDLPMIVGPLSLLIYRVFNFLHGYIPNYGWVIIVFALALNLLMLPLTAKSYASMKKMQEIQPLMKEMQAKYKGDPQTLQKKQVAFYKEHKVNPVGGCLPMLLQMPVFFAIYPLFRTIELRGAEFIFWIKDLSVPDVVYTLPFTIPFFGSEISILIFIYAFSMFVQQKVMVTDPKQKAMIYIMPVMMLFLLKNLSSGFILYFIIFNLLSVAQRFMVHDKKDDKPKRKPVVAAPGVGSIGNASQRSTGKKKKKK